MENLVFSCLLVWAFTALLTADAAVVRTVRSNAVEDKIVVSKVLDSQQTSEYTNKEAAKNSTEKSYETQITAEDFLIFSGFKIESPKLSDKTVEKAPLDARDFLIWKAYNPNSRLCPELPLKISPWLDHAFLKEYYEVLSSITNPLLVNKEAPVLDDGFLDQSERNAALSSQQNPLQLGNLAVLEGEGPFDWSTTFLEIQNALSQKHEQNGKFGNLGAKAQRTLMCYKTDGFAIKQVRCEGSCVWKSSQGYVAKGCVPTVHKDAIIYGIGGLTRYCNTDLCN